MPVLYIHALYGSARLLMSALLFNDIYCEFLFKNLISHFLPWMIFKDSEAGSN